MTQNDPALLDPSFPKLLCNITQPASGGKKALFKGSLYFPGLKNHSTLSFNFLRSDLNHMAIPKCKRG